MIGILLINLGTPAAPTEAAVRDYLRVFLSDPYVITLPNFLRKFLVEKIILPTRSKKSAHAYQKIWTTHGSPLLVNSIALQQKLSKKLGDQYYVALGMRYGNPSIEDALKILYEKNCEKIIVLPLFPQFTKATSQSAIDEVLRYAKIKNLTEKLMIIKEFYDADFYITSVVRDIRQSLEENPSEFLLLSYHGLPQKQIEQKNNYQEKCYATSNRIADKLQLSTEKYQVSFQSRLGLAKWIGPHTDRVLVELRKKKIENLSVACPSFIADCVETLEEINIRLRAQWMQLGGKNFYFIPCLNAKDYWVDALANRLEKQTAANNE